METLVLSTGFEPVARIPWQRAITLLFLGKVEVVEEYEDKVIHSVSFEVRMPSVIRVLRGVRSKHRSVRFTRENVYSRDRMRCQYCLLRVTRQEATYDHVLPRAQGGRTTWENVVIACFRCNQRKGGRTPEQAAMQLGVLPVKPKKLPDALRLTFVYERGMPLSWKKFLRDVTYWHGELEE
ncbi:MAG: HNH endonuclease [Myxococcota bacterium]|nr:HNH endonuclease [Myxococcota bacterium]